MNKETIDWLTTTAELFKTFHPEIKGGLGLTPETAWIMPNEHHYDAVGAEYHILACVFGCRSSRQKLCKKDGRYYDVLTATMPDTEDQPQQIEVWFDISAKFAGR